MALIACIDVALFRKNGVICHKLKPDSRSKGNAGWITNAASLRWSESDGMIAGNAYPALLRSHVRLARTTN